jgi:serine protease
MPRPAAVLAAMCALLVAPALAQTPPPTSDVAQRARVIVKYKADSALLAKEAHAGGTPGAMRVKALGARIGLALRAGADVSERVHVVFADGMTSEQLAQRLGSESDVEYAVPDELRFISAAPNDPFYLTRPIVETGIGGPVAGQWYLRAPAGDVQSSINVEPAWNITTGSSTIVVAVLDTGVRFDHPDLLSVANGGNLLPGYDMVSDATIANDGDGRDADASDPGDWISQAEAEAGFLGCYLFGNSSWHGTKTSGLIGALTGNGIGMASVGRNVRVLPVRVLGKCGGLVSDIVAGMRWAAGLDVPGVPANPTPARVLNLSLGGDRPCNAAERDAVAEIIARGIVVVASAGNATGHAIDAPASCPGVIAVAGLEHVGTKSSSSNLGPEAAIATAGGNCVNTSASTPCLYPILTTTNNGLWTPLSDAAGGSEYTDSFRPSGGTSASAALVSGTVALMLSVQPSLTPANVRAMLQTSARPFPTSGGSNNGGTPLPQCKAPQPIDAVQTNQGSCYCTTATCGAGMLDAGAAVLAAQRNMPLNYTGLFYNAPAESESGWGVNVAHQGDVIFATWFTYDLTGKAWWLSMTANKTADGAYTGTLYQTNGPAFSAVPFKPTAVTSLVVGSGTLRFSDADNGTFTYSVNGNAQTKSITRQVFRTPVPTCTFGAQSDLALATNFQDLWYAAPAESEAGWGVNFAHQGDIIFATWFTYDTDGAPLWLSATTNTTGNGVYAGTLYRTTGPAFNAVPFLPSSVKLTAVGTATLTFANGNSGTFAYTVNGVSQTKPIVRQVFRAPGTVCQ